MCPVRAPSSPESHADGSTDGSVGREGGDSTVSSPLRPVEESVSSADSSSADVSAVSAIARSAVESQTTCRLVHKDQEVEEGIALRGNSTAERLATAVKGWCVVDATSGEVLRTESDLCDAQSVAKTVMKTLKELGKLLKTDEELVRLTITFEGMEYIVAAKTEQRQGADGSSSSCSERKPAESHSSNGSCSQRGDECTVLYILRRPNSFSFPGS